MVTRRQEFAKMFGVSYGTLQSYEYGNTQPKFEFTKKISDFFKISLDYFYKDDKNLSSIENYSSKLKVNDDRANFYDYKELFALIMDFATPKMLEKWKKQLLEIKGLSEED